MFSEILDAITEYYKDDEDVLVDCLLYLAELNPEKAGEALFNMNRCPRCGATLQEYEWREKHYELDGAPYEYGVELACPECDFGG